MQKKIKPVIHLRIFLSLVALFLATLACSGVEDPRVVTANDMNDKNLSKGNWFFASFCDLNLSGKDFSNADLGNSIFQKVNLERAVLRGADLSYASLEFANLSGADLTGANLNHASFTSADLTGAILDEKWSKIMPLLVSGDGEAAELQGYELRNVNFHRYTPSQLFCDHNLYEWDQGFVFNLSRANLENAALDGANLYHVNLQNANLRFATLKNTSLAEANLEGANLEETDLQNASMWSTHLKGASLFGANLSEAQLTHADLQNADLRQANLEKTDLQFAVLTDALVDQNELQHAILGCTVLPDGTIYTPENCKGQTPGPAMWLNE